MSGSLRDECTRALPGWAVGSAVVLSVLLIWNQYVQELGRNTFWSLLVAGLGNLEMLRLYRHPGPHHWLHPERSWQYYAICWPTVSVALLVTWQLLFATAPLPDTPDTLVDVVSLAATVVLSASYNLLAPALILADRRRPT